MKEDIVCFDRTDHPFGIQMAGISYCDGTYRIQRACSPITCIEYIIDGTGTVVRDGTAYRASTGDVYILRKGEPHLYYSDAERPWTKIWLNIDGDLALDMLLRYVPEHAPVFENCAALPFFRQMHALIRSDKTAKDIFDECFLIYARLIQFIANGKQTPATDNLATRVRAAIDEDRENRLTVEALAKRFFCSKSYVITVFRRAYGTTPHRYITEKRMRAAGMLLKNTSLSVAEIAEQLNFCDNHYFSAAFREHTGMTPLAYRKSQG